MNKELIIAIVILAAVWFLIYVICTILNVEERFGWTVGPIFLLIRTKWFNDFIRRLAKKHARFWRIFGNISIVTGLLSMLASFGLFTYSLIDFFLPKGVSATTGGAVGLIIPGVTISFKTFLYLIIPLILTMIPHELAHGVVAHADGVKLKSTGLAFFAIFFGAFVEPEEESMLDASPETKMRTFAAGIFPNLLLGLITIPVLIFSSNILSPLYYAPDGILVLEVIGGSPADESGLERGSVIYAIDGQHLYNSTTFSTIMAQTSPNQTLSLTTSKDNLTVTLATNPNNATIGYLGIRSMDYREPKVAFASKFFPYFFTQELIWTLVISFGAVMLNALPLPVIVDGDKLLSTTLLSKMSNTKVAKIILSLLRFFALFLFLANIILPIIRYGLVPIGF
ncbi:MAG: PDZ domain-containing protein [Candidatus Heimdallarchaeota archaeon]|nr:PDZ domain-containing protein [Candidatus Heimdallarchaeota archaeon]